MDGNKPKQRVEKPVDKQSNTLNLNEELNMPVGGGQAIDIPQPLPNYTPQSFYTRKTVTRAHAKKRRKIARKSKQVNRRRNK